MAEACGPGTKHGFARKLASSDKSTREKAIAVLVLWLSYQQQVGEDELKKIWKGLFYCVWHADKAPVQAELIERLAGLLESVGVEVSVSFFKVFLSTMRREWGGIDRLRLDKFYLLLRKFLSHVFKVLEKQGWDQKLVARFMGALEERAFLARDRFPAVGVNLHFTDVFWDEFRKFLPVPEGTLELLLEPFFAILSTSTDKALLKRVRENIFIPLLEDARALGNIEKERALDGSAGKIGCLLDSSSVAPRLFDLASSPTTAQANRKILYELNDEFCKVAKSFSSLKGAAEEMNGHGAGVQNAPPAAEDGANLAEARSEDVDGGSGSRLRKRQAKAAAVGVEPPFQGMRVKQVKKAKRVKGRRSPAVGGGQEAAKPLEQTESGDLYLAVMDTAGRESAMADVLDVPLQMKSRKRKAKKKKRAARACLENVAAEPGAPHKAVAAVVREPESNIRQGGQASPIQSECTPRFGQGVGEASPAVEATTDFVAAGDNRSFARDAVACSPPGSPLETRSRRKRKRDKATVQVLSRRAGAPNATENGIDPASPPLQAVVCERPLSESAKKAKKVRFALRQNLICKPHGPLPPLSVRTPPSATPRGSALKSGVPAGPIRTRPLRIVRGTGLGKARKRASRQFLTISMQKVTKRTTKRSKIRRKP